MPIVMTVTWKHILLDPAVFQSSGTYRVARVRIGTRTGIDAFPVKAFGTWESENRYWSPQLSGEAPPSYDHEERHFNLGFWSVKTFVDGSLHAGTCPNTNGFDITNPHGIVRVEANAIYYWDFGDGEGEHAVYVDAFDTTNQRFIGNDFVDVIPDDSGRTLTAEANNGRLATEAIGSLVIRARSPIESTTHYSFSLWTNEQDLSRYGPETVPTIEGQDIHIRQRSVIAALARYTVPPPLPPPDIREPDQPQVGGYVIGNLAGGQFLGSGSIRGEIVHSL